MSKFYTDDLVRAREDELWQEVFVATMLGKAGTLQDGRLNIGAKCLAAEAQLIADAALDKYREYLNKRDLEDEGETIGEPA